MKKPVIAILFLILGILVVPLCAWIYLNYGHPPVAVADPSFPMEAQIVHGPLNKRIQSEMATSTLPINEATLTEGANVYMSECAFCHGTPNKASKEGANMFPDAPALWVKHHGGAVVGVSDDPIGETYWKVKNGIRLTGMPSYVKILSDQQMWEVSGLLSVADKPLPDAESIACAAASTPDRKASASPLTSSTAAAFSRTISRRGPGSPAKIPRRIAAFSSAPPPCRASCEVVSPASSGRIVYCLTSVPFTSATMLSSESESSSSPPAPCTTRACCMCPLRASASAISGTACAEYTPITCRRAPAGFPMGPSRLNTVRNGNARRTGATIFIAGCMRVASRKAKPCARNVSVADSAVCSVGMSSAASTSADPHREVTARLPCLATRAPAAHATSATAVEMLKVPLPSPPVPQVSTSVSRSASVRGSLIAADRMASENPASSAAVSPRSCSALKSADISFSLNSPVNSACINARASSIDNVSPPFNTVCSRFIGSIPLSSRMSARRAINGRLCGIHLRASPQSATIPVLHQTLQREFVAR
jgi:thiosulfate dehydrogenase